MASPRMEQLAMSRSGAVRVFASRGPQHQRRAGKVVALVAAVAALSYAPAFLPGSAPMRPLAPAKAAKGIPLAGLRLMSADFIGGSRIPMAADYSGMKVSELKELLKEKGLAVGGTKAVLIERLEEAEGSDGADAEEAAEEAEEEEEEEEAEESSSSSGSSSSPGEFKAGQLARAKFHDDGKFYTVKIKKDNGDDTFDIIWAEDGAEDTANLEDLREQDKAFKKGDLVVAKCAQDGKRYTATFVKADGEGRTTVAWLEDGSEEDVLLDDVFPQKKKFKVGQAVEAKFPDDGEFYGAKVLKDLGKGKYSVEWDEDGDGPSELLVDDLRIPRVDIETFSVGQKLQGTILRVAPFGAFVDVGAWSDGLIHVSKMSEGFVSNPEDFVSEDQEVTVWVTNVDTEQRRLGLTLIESKISGGGGPRAPREVTNPMDSLEIGGKYEGTVESVRDFGAFVDIGAERAGLVHVSRISDGFVENPADHVSVGQKVTVWVTGTDDGKLALSMKEDAF
eukprot:gb/GFBE01008759.1/.p1 GENE.gb/GFBE01008759.1/~~gb/GFBE01008759.1/.p1  ORF type:complete len:505 (+),score=149.18 gb/GFBE01008759.1/:1-1515(+)